jgi:uncharacterized iron-regulated membrane protein
VHVDQHTGEVLQDDAHRARSRGDVVVAWMAPLHVGNFAGGGTKLVWGGFALTGPFLAVTAAVLTLRRVRRR